MKSKSSELSVETEIRMLELRMLDPQVRANREALGALLADDFVEFGSSGRTFSRDQVMAFLEKEPARRHSIRGFRLRCLGPASVLVTYRAAARLPSEKVTRRSLRSSVWIRSRGRWRIAFHQGTLLAAVPARRRAAGRR